MPQVQIYGEAFDATADLTLLIIFAANTASGFVAPQALNIEGEVFSLVVQKPVPTCQLCWT